MTQTSEISMYRGREWHRGAITQTSEIIINNLWRAITQRRKVMINNLWRASPEMPSLVKMKGARSLLTISGEPEMPSLVGHFSAKEPLIIGLFGAK